MKILILDEAEEDIVNGYRFYERVLWGMWATVPMVTLVVDANLTGQKKEGIEPQIRQVSAESAPTAPPVEPST